MKKNLTDFKKMKLAEEVLDVYNDMRFCETVEKPVAIVNLPDGRQAVIKVLISADVDEVEDGRDMLSKNTEG